MYYVYFIYSKNFPNKRYIGFTQNLKQSFLVYNSGKSKHTSKFKPWVLHSYFAFQTEDSARKFEKYLKTGSGRGFALKHFS